LLTADEARALEPALDQGAAAVRLATGYPVVPQAATLAFGRRATRAGAELHLGGVATPVIGDGRATGVRLPGGEVVTAGQVLVAAGPWTPPLLPGWQAEPPIRRSWGVVVSLAVRRPPRHILEQHGIEPGGWTAPTAFSMVSAGGASSVGSTFLPDEPASTARDGWAKRLLAAGTSFVPALADARQTGVRACARPLAFDGRPLIGATAVEGLFVCAGHGPWGLSTGPASARLVVSQMLGGAAIEPALAAMRWPWRPAAGAAEALP
jgi:glycine oxidase